VPRASAIRQLRLQQATQPEAQGYTLAAPVGGINARDALANMPETDAIVLDNMFCQPSWVELRRGKATLATFTGNCLSVMAYNAISGLNLLFAGVISAGVGSIYRVDNAGGGSAGSPVVGGAGNTIQQVTNVQYDWTMLGTGTAEALVLANGVDNPLIYDGTWHSITASSSPYAWTSGPSPLTSLSQVVRYKSRLWFVQAGTLNVYYLPQNVFAGAMTLLPMGPNFNQGGSLACIVTNSVDNSAGITDYIAFVSTQGEVVMFEGFDPAQASTWFEVGHFQIGSPLAVGRRAWAKIGSDAALLTTDGLIPISKALVTDRSQPTVAITDKIRTAINGNAQTFGQNFGWQVVLYPTGQKIVVNVPISATASFQFVQNTISGAWSTWGQILSSWNPFCFELMSNNIYFGASGYVAQGDVGNNDDGNSYIVTAQPAFSYFGDPELLKIYTQCQPIFQVGGALTVVINLLTDFSTTAFPETIPVSTVTGAQWNVAMWNVSSWGDNQQIIKPWIGLNGTGYSSSMQMKANVNGVTAKWQSTNFLYKKGSFFYG
jgi:hypothetical protein